MSLQVYRRFTTVALLLLNQAAVDSASVTGLRSDRPSEPSTMLQAVTPDGEARRDHDDDSCPDSGGESNTLMQTHADVEVKEAHQEASKLQQASDADDANVSNSAAADDALDVPVQNALASLTVDEDELPNVSDGMTEVPVQSVRVSVNVTEEQHINVSEDGLPLTSKTVPVNISEERLGAAIPVQSKSIPVSISQEGAAIPVQSKSVPVNISEERLGAAIPVQTTSVSVNISEERLGAAIPVQSKSVSVNVSQERLEEASHTHVAPVQSKSVPVNVFHEHTVTDDMVDSPLQMGSKHHSKLVKDIAERKPHASASAHSSKLAAAGGEQGLTKSSKFTAGSKVHYLRVAGMPHKLVGVFAALACLWGVLHMCKGSFRRGVAPPAKNDPLNYLYASRLAELRHPR